MRKTLYAGIVAFSMITLLGGCATTGYQAYERDMLAGKGMLKDRDYTEARRFFQDASEYYRDSIALTYLAVVDYKTENYERALQYIQEAEKIGTDKFFYLRTMAYKALILLRIDTAQGIAALRAYVDDYQHQYPLNSIKEIQRMLRDGQVDPERLEVLIDEQLKTYETDIELYLKNGIGFYNRYSGGVDRQ